MSSQRVAPGLQPDQLVANERFVRALIRRFVADPHLADDLVQETWLAALRHSAAAGFLERAWLGTVAKNFAFQALRGRARRLAREAAVARSLALDAEGEPRVDDELRRSVLDAVEGLDARYREVIRLRFFEDLPPTQIAERLGVPLETVRTRLKRALRRIQALVRTRG